MSLLLLLNQAGGSTTTIEPSKGATQINGYAPDVLRSSSVDPSTGHIALTGAQPSVAQTKHQSVVPSTGRLNLAGKPPSVSQTAHKAVFPASAHSILTGRQPTLTQTVSTILSPATGHVTLQGGVPLVRLDEVVSPVAANILLLGKSPTVLQTANQIVLPFTGRVSLRCHAPKVERTVKITSDDLTMLTEIWARMELDATRPVTVSPTTLEFDGVVQTHSAEGASRHGPTLPANEAPGQMILEVWQRLGLDPENPLVQTPVAISAGAINLTLSEAAGSITVTRNA